MRGIKISPLKRIPLGILQVSLLVGTLYSGVSTAASKKIVRTSFDTKKTCSRDIPLVTISLECLSAVPCETPMVSHLIGFQEIKHKKNFSYQNNHLYTYSGLSPPTFI